VDATTAAALVWLAEELQRRLMQHDNSCRKMLPQHAKVAARLVRVLRRKQPVHNSSKSSSSNSLLPVEAFKLPFGPQVVGGHRSTGGISDAGHVASDCGAAPAVV
jgi:hypothetical protein